MLTILCTRYGAYTSVKSVTYKRGFLINYIIPELKTTIVDIRHLKLNPYINHFSTTIPYYMDDSNSEGHVWSPFDENEQDGESNQDTDTASTTREETSRAIDELNVIQDRTVATTNRLIEEAWTQMMETLEKHELPEDAYWQAVDCVNVIGRKGRELSELDEDDHMAWDSLSEMTSMAKEGVPALREAVQLGHDNSSLLSDESKSQFKFTANRLNDANDALNHIEDVSSIKAELKSAGTVTSEIRERIDKANQATEELHNWQNSYQRITNESERLTSNPPTRVNTKSEQWNPFLEEELSSSGAVGSSSEQFNPYGEGPSNWSGVRRSSSEESLYVEESHNRSVTDNSSRVTDASAVEDVSDSVNASVARDTYDGDDDDDPNVDSNSGADTSSGANSGNSNSTNTGSSTDSGTSHGVNNRTAFGEDIHDNYIRLLDEHIDPMDNTFDYFDSDFDFEYLDYFLLLFICISNCIIILLHWLSV